MVLAVSFLQAEYRHIVIMGLLQHDPSKRPTAAELSQSPLLPPKVEDEYFKGALKLIGWSCCSCADN